MSPGVFNLPEIRGTQLHLCGRNVFLQLLNAASSGNRNAPRLLSEHPGKGELRRRQASRSRNCRQRIHQRDVLRAVLFLEARMAVADVGSVKLPIAADCTGEEATTEGTVRHEANAQLFKRGKDEILGLAHPK